MHRPLLLVHDPGFGGMGHGARFLLDACAATGIAVNTLQLTTPGRGEDVQGRIGRESAQHAVRLYAQFTWRILTRRPRLVYLPIAQWGLPLARDLMLVATARALRTPVVLHLHGSQLVEKVSSPRSAFDRVARVLLRSQRWAVLSPALQARLVESGAAQDVRVLRNPAFPPPADERLAPAHDELRVGFLGLCCTEKGLDVLCAAVRMLRAEGRDARLTVAGPVGDYRPPAEPWLTYLGKVERATLESSFWPNVDVLALPARWQEGLPFVILEALQRGKLTLAADSLGLRELIDAGAVAVVAPDAEECARALVAAPAMLTPGAWQRIAPAFEPTRVREEWLAGLGLQGETASGTAGATSSASASSSGR